MTIENAIANFSFSDFLVTFMSILFEALPFIVLGALISGMLEELLPQQFFNRWLPKNRVLAIMGSSFMGILLPMCECGIVAVMRRLLSKGVPASCAVAYMLSAPIINPIVLSGTALAFWGTYDFFGVGGLGMVFLRGGAAFITAVSVALIMERLAKNNVPIIRDDIIRARLVGGEESLRLLEKDVPSGHHEHAHEADHSHADHEHRHVHDHAHEHGHEHSHGHAHDHGEAHAQSHSHGPARPRSVLDRMTAIADIALGDFLDIAAFLVIGAALAALVRTALPTEKLEDLSQYQTASVAGMMGLAILLSLCSEADAFVAANFISISVGAKLAFLVLGPMLDIKLYIMYQWVFTRRAVWTMICALVAIIFSIGVSVNLLEPYWREWFESTLAPRSPG